MAMAMVALRVVRSTLPLGVVSGHGALDDAGADAQPPAGHEAGQDEPADGPGQVGDGAGEDAGGEDDLVAGGVQGDGEAGPVGVGARDGAGGVGDRGAQHLVGDQQGVDLLVDAVGGAGAQDPAAEDGGLELEVGGLDLPALAVENGDLAGGVAGRVEQGGDQPAAGGARPALVVTVTCASMTRTGIAAEARQPGPVGQAAQDREPRGAVPGRGPGSGSPPWFPRSARPGTRRRSCGRPAGSSPRAGCRAGPGRRWSRRWRRG